MPKGNPRGWADCRKDLTRQRQLFPELEATPDLSRGEIRFAAETLLASLRGLNPPEPIMERALTIANTMARG